MDDLQFHKQLIADIFTAKIDGLKHERSGAVENLSDYAIGCAGILIGKMKEHFEESVDEPSEDIKYVPASIDFSKIPKDLEGKWVVIDKINNEPLGFGVTPEQALNMSCRSFNDPNIVMTKVNRYGGRWIIEMVEKKND